MKVYLLQHSYEYEICEEVQTEETKIIGIYSSEEKAKKAKTLFLTKQGFRIFTEDCFYIDAYQLDEDNWREGFVTWDGELGAWIDD